MVKYILVWKKMIYMKKDNKLKYGNSLETQFWSDNIKVDSNSPLTKIVDKLQNCKDYIPTAEEKEKFDKDMKKYHTKDTPN